MVGCDRMSRAQRSGPSQAERSLISLLVKRHADAARQTVARIRSAPLKASLMSLVIAFAMTLPALLLLLSLNVQTQLGNLDDTAEITAYFPVDLPEDRVSEISEYLQMQIGDTEIRYVPTTLALAQLNESVIFKPILDALESNPLPAALIVRPEEPSVATALEIERILLGLAEIEMVQLDTTWLQRLEAWLRLLDSLLLALYLIIVCGLLLIIAHAVGSSVQSRREEIRIMKQFGGTDAFIRRPFLYFGVLIGAAGGTLTCLLTAGIGHQLGVAAKALALLYQADFALVGLSFEQNLAMIVLSASIGGLSAFLAVSGKIASFNP